MICKYHTTLYIDEKPATYDEKGRKNKLHGSK